MFTTHNMDTGFRIRIVFIETALYMKFILHINQQSLRSLVRADVTAAAPQSGSALKFTHLSQNMEIDLLLMAHMH